MIFSGWKEISGYLRCSSRTAQRWEAFAKLPVQRPRGAAERGTVIAFEEELDAWLRRQANGDPAQALGCDPLQASRRLCELAKASIAESQQSRKQSRRLRECNRLEWVSLFRQVALVRSTAEFAVRSSAPPAF
jgi:hypothetical protein